MSEGASETIAGSRAVVRAHAVTVAYQNRVAVADVSLTLSRSRITAIIGPSGCGKTSFLQTINRISDVIPGCTVRGEVIVDEVNVFAPTTDVVKLRRKVGMIFQKPNPFPLSIRKNIHLALREHRICRRDELDAVTEGALREVGLWAEVRDRLDSSALRLSGGQQQRLCIARALALQPSVLLLDEPCSALDPIATRTIEELIRSLSHRATMVMVTHNLAQARRLADDVAFFWYEQGAGRLVESGPADEVFTNPRSPVTAAYLQGLHG